MTRREVATHSQYLDILNLLQILLLEPRKDILLVLNMSLIALLDILLDSLSRPILALLLAGIRVIQTMYAQHATNTLSWVRGPNTSDFSAATKAPLDSASLSTFSRASRQALRNVVLSSAGSTT